MCSRFVLQLKSPMLCVGLATAVCVPSALAGQQAVRSQELKRGNCPGCQVRWTRQAILYEGGEEHGGVQWGGLFADPRGNFYSLAKSHLLVFDSTGKYVRAIGRNGSGPGEFTAISFGVASQDGYLHVYDQSQKAYSLLRSDYSLVSKVAVGGRFHEAISLRPGLLVVNATIPSPSSFGYPLHLLIDGRLAGPTGPEVLDGRSRTETFEMRRALARASDSTYWAAHGDSYTIDLMSTSGKILKRFTRNTSWFTIKPRTTPEGVLNPKIMALDVDAQGRLWVFAHLRARGWENMYVEVRPPSERTAFISVKPGYKSSQLMERIIEVIDPQRAEVLVSARYPWTLGTFVAPGKMSSYEEDDLGRPRISIVRVSITQPNRGR